ncbi:hypothetical protein AAHS21_00310 [Mycobacterium sp. 050272]|uniref:hypothetical protein n=1 Tax=Mycobacterium sp. 050272 TaxID=3142488 RepID=UPI003186D496
MNYPQQWPPPQWPPPQPPHIQQQWPSPYPPPPYPPAPAPRKTNRALVVVLSLAAIVLLVPAAIIGFFVVRDIARDGRGESRKAASITDFDAVCDGGSIRNAAGYGKPYKIAAFAPDDEPNPMRELTNTHWREVTLDSRADYRANPNDFLSTNVVACLNRKPGTEVKSLTCNLKTDKGEHVTVDYYAVQYDIELREARTGKQIAQLGTVDGPAASCPFLVWVNKGDPKTYAGPDHAAVDAKLADFAHS